MSHRTKAVSKMTNKDYIITALSMLNIQHEVANEGSKLLGRSNYSTREDVSNIDVLLSEFKGSKGFASVGFHKAKDGTYVLEGDSYTVRDVNASRSPKYTVLDKNNQNLNVEKLNNQISRFYTLALIQDSVKSKAMSLVDDSVKEVNEGKDTVLKFQLETFVNSEQVFLNCVAKSNGEVEYEVKGLKGSGCKDLTDFVDSQLNVLSSVETEEANMELDVENSHSEFH